MATARQPRRRGTIALLAVLGLAAIAATLLALRGRALDRPAEHSPGYHLDPTELAALEVGEAGPGVRILCYHYFRPGFDPGYLLRVAGAVILGMPTLGPQEFWTTPIGQFERHLRYFRDAGVAVLSLDEIAERQARGEPLPDPAVVITIDDADRSVYELAWPLLQQYGVRAHLFVPTSRVGGRWSGIHVCDWTELREMADSGTILVGSHTHDLHYKVGTDLGRQPVFWNPDRIDAAAHGGLRRTLRELAPDAVDAAGDGSAGADLAALDDPVAADLLLSRRLVERHTGHPCRWLAWPYGFGSGALDRTAARAGFAGTLSLRPVVVMDATPTWHLGRFALTAKTTPQDVAALFPAAGER
ncbi:MAG TPA: polysaccharide deacetylase family protein [Candidatus Krumholzibacteria bacterium]|nr:polysaccharide deacetylase family protein [Candidatus Krumholzibacteria bacterium]HPD72638.1 polysaccharide deacetylase family protein [Candidatus Krumholzibacteria bacterium]HRY40430.1 polysaccharide deacetylase family protein [Candidatus Krumholzibacteria bacterium]